MNVGIFRGQGLPEAGQAGVFGVERISFVQCPDRRILDISRRGHVGFAEMQFVDAFHAESDVGQFPYARWRDVGKGRGKRDGSHGVFRSGQDGFGVASRGSAALSVFLAMSPCVASWFAVSWLCRFGADPAPVNRVQR